MKKLHFMLIFVIVFAFLFAACGQDAELSTPNGENEQKPQVVVPSTDNPAPEPAGYTGAGYAFNNRFLDEIPGDKYGDYSHRMFTGATNAILVSSKTEAGELFGETYNFYFDEKDGSLVKDSHFQDVISKYNDDYFENHQLLTFFLGTGNSADRNELKSVVYTDGVLTAAFECLEGGGACVCECWFAILEIKKIPSDTKIEINVERNWNYIDPDSKYYVYPHYYMFTPFVMDTPVVPPTEGLTTEIKYLPYVYGLSYGEWYHAYILKSKAQKDDFIVKVDGYSSTDYPLASDLNEYNDSFFIGYNLVMIPVHLNYGQLEVETIDVKNNKLNVVINYQSANITVMRQWLVLIPVKKDYFNGDIVNIDIPWLHY